MSRVSLGASLVAVILLGTSLANHTKAQEGSEIGGAGSSGEMGMEGGYPGGHGGEPTSAERIEAALNQRLQQPLQYVQQPLNDIIDMLQEEFNVPILFDTAALDEVAISPDTEVNLNLRNVSLHSVLNILLRQPGLEDLCYTVVDEVLLITTVEKANEALTVRVYPVADLIEGNTQVGRGNLESIYSSLIEVTTVSVEFDTWKINGSGEGTICLMQPGMLIVAQTRRVQDQVQALLEKLREAKAAIQQNRGKNSNHGRF